MDTPFANTEIKCSCGLSNTEGIHDGTMHRIEAPCYLIDEDRGTCLFPSEIEETSMAPEDLVEEKDAPTLYEWQPVAEWAKSHGYTPQAGYLKAHKLPAHLVDTTKPLKVVKGAPWPASKSLGWPKGKKRGSLKNPIILEAEGYQAGA